MGGILGQQHCASTACRFAAASRLPCLFFTAVLAGQPPRPICPHACYPARSRTCNHEFAGASASAPDLPAEVKAGGFMVTKSRKQVRPCCAC